MFKQSILETEGSFEGTKKGINVDVHVDERHGHVKDVNNKDVNNKDRNVNDVNNKDVHVNDVDDKHEHVKDGYETPRKLIYNTAKEGD